MKLAATWNLPSHAASRTPGRRAAIVALAAAAALHPVAALPATEATSALPDGSEVRLRASGLGSSDWIGGKVSRTRAGCVLIVFDKAQAGGYASASLGGASALQRKQGATWVDVDARALHKAEGKDCQGDND